VCSDSFHSDIVGDQSVRERSEIRAVKRSGRNQQSDPFVRRVQHNEKFHGRTSNDFFVIILFVRIWGVCYFCVKCSSQEFKYDRSAMFMDLKYVVPTGIGMPLILDAVGTSEVNFNMSSYINADAFKNFGEFKLLTKIYPR